MKNQIISSKMAAQYCHSGRSWPDEWVTADVVMRHFGFCERTLRTFVKNDMPKHLIGRKRMRFVLGEVYAWLVKEGALRFAAIGLANTLRQTSVAGASPPVSVPIPPGLTVNNRPPLSEPPPPSFDHAVASIVAELKALRTAQTRRTPQQRIAPPRCKPGRKPKNPDASTVKARCRKGNHRWRVSAHHRICVDCHHVQERTP